MDLATFQGQQTLEIRQRITFMVNRYEIWAGGQIIGLAEQKRMTMREQVTFFGDEGKSVPLFGFKARQIMDLGATYDVTAPDGSVLGNFRKDFGKSLLRSTWHLTQPGLGECTGTERNQVIAILRRFTDFSWPYHFDFTTPDGRPIFSVERQWALRDKYGVTIHDPAIDRRLVAAMSVALDALQAR